MNTVHIHTISLGCPKNQVDTEWILGNFGRNIALVPNPSQADVVLINTCGFIEPAVSESLEVILDVIQEISTLNPKPVLVVTGCLVNRYGQSLEQELPEVDLFVNIANQPELIHKLTHKIPLKPQTAKKRLLTTASGYAYIKIAEGCNNQCRFCTIPSIRGPLHSRSMDKIIDDAKFCLDQGRKELVIIAQDVTAYGQDLRDPHALKKLLEKLALLPGLEWLRLMYLYPAGLTQDFLQFLAHLGTPFIPYFDIPLQHAHPEILSAMGRPFQHDPRKIIDRVRSFFPQAALRTTCIVGYPGETDQHFQTLENFVRDVQFTHLGVFPFYPEEGVQATLLPDQIPSVIKEERRHRIMSIQAEISQNYLEQFAFQDLDVLIDQANDEWPGLYEGRVWFQAPEVDGLTYISGADVAPGQMIKATIDETKTYDLVALA